MVKPRPPGVRVIDFNAPTPLRAYAPGALAHLTPEQRARTLKRTGKRPKYEPSLMSHILTGAG